MLALDRFFFSSNELRITQVYVNENDCVEHAMMVVRAVKNNSQVMHCSSRHNMSLHVQLVDEWIIAIERHSEYAPNLSMTSGFERFLLV